MRFRTRKSADRPNGNTPDGAYLQADNWNDYGFTTLWTLWVVKGGQKHEIGPVKIADREDSKSPQIPSSFTSLPAGFFSLGQEEGYYEQLRGLGNADRVAVLTGLNDLAFDKDLLREVEQLKVTRDSLLRWVQAQTVRTQFHRIARGGVTQSPYSFSYYTPDHDRHGSTTIPRKLDFQVVPYAKPRSNIHVLIGRNGVGKSFTLNDIATALAHHDSAGRVEFDQQNDELLANRFTSVISVAYSAFDAFEPRRPSNAAGVLRNHYLGLKRVRKENEVRSALKDHVLLAQEFGTSLKACSEARRLDRWQNILGFLASDPLFADAVERIFRAGGEPNNVRKVARQIFGDMSSGHKIVLLILTRLVEKVEEATLVLVDEPESHLHPPLLSAFMSALSELLEERNAVAIIATHSPVVLQEVPRQCVWKLAGSGGALTAGRPGLETYGENVGTLTQEVFGLEVTASGFHRTLAEAVLDDETQDYEHILGTFGGNLGAEARAILQTMLYFERR